MKYDPYDLNKFKEQPKPVEVKAQSKLADRLCEIAFIAFVLLSSSVALYIFLR